MTYEPADGPEAHEELRFRVCRLGMELGRRIDDRWEVFLGDQDAAAL